MRVEVTRPPVAPPFQPIEVTIRLETHSDLGHMRLLCASKVAATMQTVDQRDSVQELLNMISIQVERVIR